MPELPEVEFARRCLDGWATGRVVRAVAAQRTRVLRPRTPRALGPLRGGRVDRVDRRGKNLLITLDGGRAGVWSHLGMTGKWVRRRRGDPEPRFSRVRLDLDDGHTLHYCDMRLFGRFQVVPGARFEGIPELRTLGPDPLTDGVDVGRLAARLAKIKKPIKVALLDQGLLAGVGNIQASEALFRARIDPRRSAASLGRNQVAALAGGIRRSIAATLRQFDRAVGPDGEITYVEEPGAPNPFAVYDRAGERCPRCRKSTITRIVQTGRSTYFCPRCQK